jgi:2-octaprenylphenol hydroxylase
MSEVDFDVVIAGGGMVGAAVAALIALNPELAGLRIALAEPRPPAAPLPTAPLDLRVSALSRASELLLRQVGAWPLLARAPYPYERMRIWDGADAPGSRACLVLKAASLGEPNLGHIAENVSVAAALHTVALGRGVTRLPGTVTQLELGAGEARFASGGKRFASRLIVAADGANSPLRGAAGIGWHGAPYAQSALITHLTAERPHQATAWQRFLPGGPLALLPLADGRVSLVWSLPGADAAALLALDDAAFGAAVTAASDRVLGTLAPAAPRAAFPLQRYHASRYCVPRLALVGDAAHTVHPLAGQGVNLGLLDAHALVTTLAAARTQGEDLGDLRTLGRYSRARRADNALMLAACDGLHHLFSSELPGIARLRRFGLALVNATPAVQQRLMQHALGLHARPAGAQRA